MKDPQDLFRRISRSPGAVDSFLLYDASKDRVEWRRMTKPFFFPFTAGTTALQLGTHTGYEVDLAAEKACAEMYVPEDFGSLLTAKVAWICLAATASMKFQVDTNFGAHDEAYNGATDTLDVTFTGTPTLNDLYLHDVSAALTGIAAGDIIGLTVTFDTNTDGLFLAVVGTYEVAE